MNIPTIPFTKNDIESTIGDRFRKILKAVPQEHIAYKDLNSSISYHALAEASETLAYHLWERISAKEEFQQFMVILLLDPDWREMQSMMGVAMAGHYYLALDSTRDQVQFHQYFDYPQVRALVTIKKYKDVAKDLLSEHPQCEMIVLDELETMGQSEITNPAPSINYQSNHAVYFTSGSTGAPKGILRPHSTGLISSYIAANNLGMNPSDRITLTMGLSLGMSVTPSLGALLTGATICRNLKAMTNPQTYKQWVIDEEITIARSSAGFVRGLLALPTDDLPILSLRLIDTGGESFSRSEVEKLLAMMPDGGLLNVRLASNEAGNYAMFSVKQGEEWEGDRNPNGYVPEYIEVVVVDENRKPLPPGIKGELAVRSRYLSAGYLNDREQTSAKFVVDEIDPSIKTYYTGDMGKIDKNGQVTFLGRIDNRVKVRGFTIELEAVDLALQELPQVVDSAVRVQPLPSGNKRLVGYLVLQDGNELVVSEVLGALRKVIPSYMIPSVLIATPSLPKTPSGKIDRKRLPMPALVRPSLSVPYREPTTQIEKIIADKWATLLDIDKVGLDDSFFELGGDSLLSMQMVLEMESVLEQKIPPEFFKHPTIAKFLELSTPAMTEKTFDSLEPRIDRHAQFVGAGSSGVSKVICKVFKPRNYYHSFLIRVRKPFEHQFLNMDYQDGMQWLLNWSKKPFNRDVLYRFEALTFQNFMERISKSEQSSIAYPLALTGNIWKNYLPKNRPGGVLFQESTYRFWQTFGKELHNHTPAKDHSLVKVQGYEHLFNAYQEGNGVILLSYHGTVGRVPAFLIPKWLDCDYMPVISPRLSLRRSIGATTTNLSTENSILRDRVEHSRHGAYAMLRGYRELSEGKIIRVYVDNGVTSRGDWPTKVCGVDYQARAGWADLAAQTQSAVIPYLSYFDDDGMIHLEFQPDMAVNMADGAKDEKIQSLVAKLGDFLSKVYTTHPQSLNWDIMKNHWLIKN